MKPTIKEINERLFSDFERLTNQGYEVVGVFLQGSQNYQLDYENSDIDTKAVVLPKFDDIVDSNKWVSTTLVLEDNSHIDVKDIRLMNDCFLKQNINFLEILFTKYNYLNEEYAADWIRTMTTNKEEIAFSNPARALEAIYGDIKSKYKSMYKDAPHSHEDIEKYGYCLKDWHHMNRLLEFIGRYSDCAESRYNNKEDRECYEKILIPNNIEELLELKSNGQLLDDVKVQSKRIIEAVGIFIKDKKMQWALEYPELLEANLNVSTLLKDASREMIKKGLKKEIMN